MTINFNTIIYHYKCPDGIFGLWCAYHYNKKFFDKIGMSAGIDPINDFTNQDIIFIDVCPSVKYIIKESKKIKSITILDHHKSAYDNYIKNKNILDELDNVKFIFDMNKSGCQIAWEYFFPIFYCPWFINYCADRDLWTWKLISSKEINNGLHFNEFYDENNLEKITNLLKYTENDKQKLINDGLIINKIHQKLIDKQLEYSEHWKMFSDLANNIYYNVQVGTISIELKSEFGNLLANKNNVDFGVVWNYSPRENIWYISLRGNDNSPDLSVIASQFSGGGHAKAAGFILRENPFNKIFF